MAVSRATKVSAASNYTSGIPGAPRRVSFANIREPLEVPNLLDLQVQSFEWLVGDETWFQRRVDAGEDNPVGGLEEVLSEISPIEDFSGSMSLSFSDPRFDEVKASVDECKDKDMTYAAPLFVTAEFTNHTTGEIKSQTVFMGDFPVMTDKGTFIINGTERVVVSQLVRSPGVYFDQSVDKTTDKDVYSVKIIPSRGAWLEFDVDKRDTVGVRIDRKRRQPVTDLLPDRRQEWKFRGTTDEGPVQQRQRLTSGDRIRAPLRRRHVRPQAQREPAPAMRSRIHERTRRYDGTSPIRHVPGHGHLSRQPRPRFAARPRGQRRHPHHHGRGSQVHDQIAAIGQHPALTGGQSQLSAQPGRGRKPRAPDLVEPISGHVASLARRATRFARRKRRDHPGRAPLHG